MATFYYGQSVKDNKYYFALRDNNNEVILSSTEGYETKQSCENGIASVKRNSPEDKNYIRFDGRDGNFYFTLKAINGEPIAKSEGYSTSYARERGILNCKNEAPIAFIKFVGIY